MKEIFCVKKEELRNVAVTTVFLFLLNLLYVFRYVLLLFEYGDEAYDKFLAKCHISGFDTITYGILTEWSNAYSAPDHISRHPGLSFFLWPLAQLNSLLIWITGVNCSVFIMSCISFVCAFYSVVFIYRINVEIVGVTQKEARLLSLATFSLAYIMLATVVPDHFVMSMFFLTLVLYLSGKHIQGKGRFSVIHTVVILLLSTGVSLNNAVKVVFAAISTRCKWLVNWKLLIAVLLLSSLSYYGVCRFHDVYMSSHSEAELANGSGGVERAIVDRIGRTRQWMESGVSRSQSVVENMFGEGMILHENHLLEDAFYSTRPAIVRYTNKVNYAVEALLLVLFLAGAWRRRDSAFLCLSVGFLIMDFVLHIVLGFGIDEVYIMSAHYLFVIPLGIAYLLGSVGEKNRLRIAAVVSAVTCYLLVWNMLLYVKYLYFVNPV